MSNMPDSLTPSGDSREATREAAEWLAENMAQCPCTNPAHVRLTLKGGRYYHTWKDGRLARLSEVLEAYAAHRSAADRQEIERLRAGFCEKHAPNAAQRYSGCVICSRNEESALIEEVLKSFGWAHAEEAEMNLGGSQWYCIGDEERGTWDTSEALTRALEDYDSLREAHKKARLLAAKEQSRAERAESELAADRQEIERLRGCLSSLAEDYDRLCQSSERAETELHKWNCVMSRILAGSEYYNNPEAYVDRWRQRDELMMQTAIERNRLRTELERLRGLLRRAKPFVFCGVIQGNREETMSLRAAIRSTLSTGDAKQPGEPNQGRALSGEERDSQESPKS